MKKFALIFFFLSISFLSFSQPFTFAHVTDTHVGGSTGAEDLERTVADINSLPEVAFVLITGDVTEFGSREELEEAHRILDSLKKPWHAVPGNHDSKWSESGCNDFVQIFGSETFSFEYNRIRFIGTASGPTMRMAPALVPREQLLWLEATLREMKDPRQPVIFINHYPLDESMSNSGKVLELLQRRNVWVSLMGHGHSNKLYDFGGIPGVMGRSCLRAGKERGGYTIVTVKEDSLLFAERITGMKTLAVWCALPLTREKEDLREKGHQAGGGVPEEPCSAIQGGTTGKPNYGEGAGIQGRVSGNLDGTGNEIIRGREKGPVPHCLWETTDESDIGAGIAVSGTICIYSRTDGHIVARDVRDGRLAWMYKTGGKVYSTPAIRGRQVVCPSTDGNIYCLDVKNGRLLWSFKTGKAIVASPVIRGNRVFTGSSEGIFRANRMAKGTLIWQYDSVANFVETRPLLYRGAVYFGSWGNAFYALDQQAGTLLWKREKYANRMLSPAAVWPVGAQGKIFIVAPDRRMTALDAETGKEIWDSGKWSCRESIGMSKDKKAVYIKNMTEGNVMAFDAKADSQRVVWECRASLGYEIAPSPLSTDGKLLFVPTTGGVIHAIALKTRHTIWKYRVSDALVNHILPFGKNQILVTTLDGNVACIGY